MKVGNNILCKDGRWSFAGSTVSEFEQHIAKSVPLYREGHELVLSLSDYFVTENSTIYEIGCSAGTLSGQLAKRHASIGASVVGLDVEKDMIDFAKARYDCENATYLVGDAVNYDFVNASLIVSYYSIQFIPVSEREKLMERIYDYLPTGGALIMFEKIISEDSSLQAMLSEIYQEFKLNNGFGPEDVLHKTRSLRGVLRSQTQSEYSTLLQNTGFKSVHPVMKMLCFEGYLAIK